MLRNKLDLVDQNELDEFEVAMTIIRGEEPSPVGRFGYTHYRALHRHLFQDVYDWAGEVRSIRIGKGGNWFCYPEYIGSEMIRIFSDLKKEKLLVGLAADVFADKAAHVLAEINAVHPFREGNGRTQLAFLLELTRNSGLPFNIDLLDRERVIAAMIGSFAGSEEPLAALIFDLVTSGH